MTLDEFKARCRRAARSATERVPGGELTELLDAIEALPDRSKLARLAPELRRPIEAALVELAS